MMTPRQRIERAEISLNTNVLGEPVRAENHTGYGPSHDRMVADAARNEEREKIAAWLECPKYCHHLTGDGHCNRIDDFCARYVAECIRNGCKP